MESLSIDVLITLNDKKTIKVNNIQDNKISVLNCNNIGGNANYFVLNDGSILVYNSDVSNSFNYFKYTEKCFVKSNCSLDNKLPLYIMLLNNYVLLFDMINEKDSYKIMLYDHSLNLLDQIEITDGGLHTLINHNNQIYGVRYYKDRNITSYMVRILVFDDKIVICNKSDDVYFCNTIPINPINPINPIDSLDPMESLNIDYNSQFSELFLKISNDYYVVDDNVFYMDDFLSGNLIFSNDKYFILLNNHPYKNTLEFYDMTNSCMYKSIHFNESILGIKVTENTLFRTIQFSD